MPLRKDQPSSRSTLAAPTKTHVFEDIFRYFIDEMVSGRLRPGDRLLAERELAQVLQVSRPSLREAVRAMSMLGVIDIRPGQGMFVRKPDAGILEDFFAVMIALQPQIYQGALMTREAIECQAIRIACEHANTADFERLQRCIDRIAATVDDAEAGAEADFAFHKVLVEASHDDIMMFVYNSLVPLLKRDHTIRRNRISHRREILDGLVASHTRILDAVMLGDKDAAEQELRRHFQIGYERPGSPRNGSWSPMAQRDDFASSENRRA